MKSAGFHEIHIKSTGFHLKSAGFHLKSANFMKSTRNLPDFMNVSFWVITKYRSFFRKTNQSFSFLAVFFEMCLAH